MNPNKRLGQGDEGWAALVRHPFFRPIDWHRLETKSIIPPFQPATDRNNFDPTFDLEELILGDTSMSAQARRQLKQQQQQQRIPKGMDEQQMTKRERDLQLIEDKFAPFDFTVFEKYEGFKDPLRMTVGDPPDWVKPAFEGAEQGDLLPVKRITTGTSSVADWQEEQINPHPLHHHRQHHHNNSSSSSRSPIKNDRRDSWRGPSRSASTSNIAANVVGHDFDEVPWKRRSLGMVRVKQHPHHHQQHQHHGEDLTITNAASPTITIAAGPGSPENNTTSLSEEYAISLQGVRKKQSTKSFRERRERDRKSINMSPPTEPSSTTTTTEGR